MAKCKDCKWKPGLDDEWTVCSSCNGSGETKTKEVKKVKEVTAKIVPEQDIPGQNLEEPFMEKVEIKKGKR